MSEGLALHLERRETDKWLSVLLALLVHIVLAALLFLGVRWQSHEPETVEVQLYSSRPAASLPPVSPLVLPPVTPLPEPQPKPLVKEPPKPQPEPAKPKPEIAQKAPEKPMRPPPEEKLEPQKEKPPLPSPDWAKELKATERTLAQAKATDSRLKATNAAAQELEQIRAAQAFKRGQAQWADRIRAAIKRYIVVPPGIQGNPEAVYDVSILPDGTVLHAKLSKSTLYPALDAAIERAIRKASPLPKPDDQSVFTRELKLTIRPLESQQE